MQYTHTSSLHLNKKKREKGDGVVPNKTSPSGLLLAFLCVCLERYERLFSQRHDCRGYGRLDPWPFVAARAGQKGLPFGSF